MQFSLWIAFKLHSVLILQVKLSPKIPNINFCKCVCVWNLTQKNNKKTYLNIACILMTEVWMLGFLTSSLRWFPSWFQDNIPWWMWRCEVVKSSWLIDRLIDWLADWLTGWLTSLVPQILRHFPQNFSWLVWFPVEVASTPITPTFISRKEEQQGWSLGSLFIPVCSSCFVGFYFFRLNKEMILLFLWRQPLGIGETDVSAF